MTILLIKSSIEMNDREKERCLRITNILFDSPCAELFREPVDPESDQAPDYYTVIKNPCDLSTLRTELEEGRIQSVNEWKAKLDLIWSNAELYNGQENVVGAFAVIMRKKAERLCQSMPNSVGEWLWRINGLFNKLNHLLSTGPKAVSKYSNQWKDWKYEEGKGLLQLHCITEKGAVAETVEILKLLGVPVENTSSELSVNVDSFPPFVVERLLKFLRMKSN